MVINDEYLLIFLFIFFDFRKEIGIFAAISNEKSMPVLASLTLKGRSYDVRLADHNFHMPTGWSGFPTQSLMGDGRLHILMDTPADNFILELMLKKEGDDAVEGSIELYDGTSDLPVRRVQFSKAYITGYKETFDPTSGSGMTTYVEITPMEMTINKVITVERKYFGLWSKVKAAAVRPREVVVDVKPTVRVTEVAAAEKTAIPFQKVECMVKAYNSRSVSSDERSRVCWRLKVDGKEIALGTRGEKITLEMRREWAGKQILVMAYLSKASEQVSAPITVKRFPPVKLFATSANLPGRDEAGRVAEDMRYKDKTYEEIQKIGWLFHIQLNVKEEMLWDNMRSLMNLGSTIWGNANLKALVAHFKGGSGATFSSAYMNEQMKKHATFKDFVYNKKNGVMTILKGALKEVKGNLHNLTVQKSVIESERTKFNTWKDRLNGMILAVDDTSAYKIYILDYELTSPNTFSCKLRIDVYDNFGLDEKDVRKFYALVGFRAWYVLQHYRGFRPFLTKMTTIIELKDEKL